jgi:hypothetical protein
MLCHVDLVRTAVSEERISSLLSVLRLLVTASVVPSSQIIVTLMMEAIHFSKTSALKKPHGVTSQKTIIFMVTAVKTSNLTNVSQFSELTPSHTQLLQCKCLYLFISYEDRPCDLVVTVLDYRIRRPWFSSRRYEIV